MLHLNHYYNMFQFVRLVSQQKDTFLLTLDKRYHKIKT